jgi:hypothetical protein
MGDNYVLRDADLIGLFCKVYLLGKGMACRFCRLKAKIQTKSNFAYITHFCRFAIFLMRARVGAGCECAPRPRSFSKTMCRIVSD